MPHGPRAGASPVGSGALACRAWQLSGAALPASAPGCPRSGWCPAGALLPPAGAAFREPARSGVSRGYGAPFPRAALPARPPRHRLRSSRASLQGGFQPELKQSPDSNSYSQPECPSSAWIPFRSSCYIFLQGTFDELDSIDDARNLCKGNDNAFKWFDKSEMKFTNWIEEESNEELLNTCASMCTKSGEWRKISCEDLPLTGTLCKTAFAYEKKYLPDKTALTTTLVIIFTIVVTVSAALFWFLYKRNISSGVLCITHHSTAEMPYSDETVLIDEENEYTA
ncbi:CD302 antigen isoform X4 [Chrysemys picta bellii]|uniref:CD302 antigen isoform X4 n=1 Tax=Chrysemys picta bellii TaxID=8478 RepID=UPI0032B1F307